MALIFLYAFFMLLARYHDSSYSNANTVLADALLLMNLVFGYVWVAVGFFDDDGASNFVCLPFVWHFLWLATTVPIHAVGGELKYDPKY